MDTFPATGTNLILKASYLDTPLGTMMAIGSSDTLYLLEFTERKNLEREITLLQQKTHSDIRPGTTNATRSIESELKQYFKRSLKKFKTPVFALGSSFQKRVWEALKKIPYGETRSYSEIANAIGMPTAVRAVAGANSQNQFAIIIPCHRVINKSGALGGYAGGIMRKEWLLTHEK